MRGLFIHLVAYAGLLASSSASIATETALAPIQPTGPWLLDGNDERCRLARTYGDAPEGHLLFIEQNQPGTGVNLAIASPLLENASPDESVHLQFGTLPSIEIDRYYRGDVGPYPLALLIGTTSLDEDRSQESEEADVGHNTIGLPHIPTERFEDVGHLEVSQDGKVVLSLALPEFKSALDALNFCAEDFVAFWGLDLEKHRSMTRRVKWMNEETVVRRIVQNYPTAALRRGEQGMVRFFVIVDDNGRVAECRHSNVTQLDKLESPVCREMRRARFDPALDESGKPMRSYYGSSLSYVLPE